ncbi:general secretion pathway protein E [Yersinia pseudotuberculosis]|nr:type IV pilus assembly protein PilB [Yersinia pseudotuberculosis]SUP88174.1 general secretion pathway protein E [Yersinia pseudotuberculosis]
MTDIESEFHTLPLTFSWSKSHGVLILPMAQGGQLICRKSATLEAILEGNRMAHSPILFNLVTDEEFENNLTERYQNNSADPYQTMSVISNEIDIYSFANELSDDDDLLDVTDEAPVIKLINSILVEAIKELASDIHIESFDKKLTVRFRIDGVLRKILELQRHVALLLVSRIKVMAKLDIAEKRIPQDGRIALNLAGRALDVRVSVLPSSHGERVVMRLLDKNSIKLDLPSLGMSKDNCISMNTQVHKPHGIILVVGPTGSGKSTTLYAALMGIDANEKNIMTVEDPIEFDIPGISQTQVNPKIEMTFARSLRAILRQDPDVILIGEIRDIETAQIAVQASLTGHLVLSTLHANSAIGAVTRLKDMNVEAFMLSSSLLAIISQRLVRRLCIACRQESSVTEKVLQRLNIDDKCSLVGSVYRAKGCNKCNLTGYRGRIALHEFLVVDNLLRGAIYKGLGEFELAKLASGAINSLLSDGISKVIAGLTTIEELVRICQEDDNGCI